MEITKNENKIKIKKWKQRLVKQKLLQYNGVKLSHLHQFRVSYKVCCYFHGR